MGQGKFLGTLINNDVQHEKERFRREKYPVFLPEIPKNCILNEKFNPKMTTIRAFFPKIVEKNKGRPPPLSPLVTHLWRKAVHEQKWLLRIFKKNSYYAQNRVNRSSFRTGGTLLLHTSLFNVLRKYFREHQLLYW